MEFAWKPLDWERAASLLAILRHDAAALRKLDERLTESWPPNTTHPDATGYKEMAAAAYTLHNLYNAMENSFEQISRTFENHVVDEAQWHKELLGKMFLEIPGVRPALLPESLRGIGNDLRGFRHIFRHSYHFDLDRVRLDTLIAEWRNQRDAIFDAYAKYERFLIAAVANRTDPPTRSPSPLD